MAEEVGLVVRVRAEGDRGSMDRLRSDISKSVQDGVSKVPPINVPEVKLPASFGGMQASIDRSMGSLKGSGALGNIPNLSRGLPSSMQSAAQAPVPENSMKGMSGLYDQVQKQAQELRKATEAQELVSKYGTADPNAIASKMQQEKMASQTAQPSSLGSIANLFRGIPVLGDLTKMAGLGGEGGATGAGGKGGGAKGGGAAAAGGVAMVAMLAIEVMKSILQAVEAIVQRLTEASPLLRNMMKMLNTGFNLILKPIGDVIGHLLRPIARFFIMIGRNVNMAMADKVAELQEQGYSSFGISGSLIASLPEIYFKALVDAVSKADWDSMINEWARVVTANFTERIPSLISLIISVFASLTMSLSSWFWGEVGKSLSNLWSTISGALGGLGSWLWGGITSALNGAWGLISGFGTWLWNGITGALGAAWGAVAGFGNWLWTSITGAIGNIASAIGGGLGSFGAWLWDGIKKAIGSIGNLGTQLATEIKKFFNNAIASLVNTIRDWGFDTKLPLVGVVKPFTGLPSIPYLASGGITNGPTLAMIGEGRGGREREVVSPLSQLPRLLGLDKQQQQAAMPPKIEVHIHGNVNGVDDLNRAIERGIDRYAYRLRGI